MTVPTQATPRPWSVVRNSGYEAEAAGAAEGLREALERIASSRFTVAPQGDGFAEGYEAGLREARGIARAALAAAYEKEPK